MDIIVINVVNKREPNIQLLHEEDNDVSVYNIFDKMLLHQYAINMGQR